MTLPRLLAGVTLGAALLGWTASGRSAEIEPLALAGFPGSRAGRFSDRTLTVSLSLDREQARLLAFTRKERPFLGPLAPAAPRRYETGETVQVEVTLLGPSGATLTRRVDVGPLCLEHDAATPPHIAGDTILVHHDSFLVELPELSGFDQIEIAYYSGDAVHPERRLVGFEVLDAARFTPTEGEGAGDGAFVPPGPQVATTGQVFWPEDFGDPDLYTVYGNASEVSQRINIVLVPDGYVYAQKALMQQHAQTMVNALRAKTPYKEHDPFINYILVYAYSTESGTDQCDCSIVKDTAMNTRFPAAGGSCGSMTNRCLYYGTANGGPNCDDTVSSANIAAAELRAPAADESLVMVNTSRYGGCGGGRAVFAAANSSAGEIAIHELGHSLAGLHDEYDGSSSCGSYNSQNVSTDAVNGLWPEWIPDLGAPRQGARFYDLCIYRPTLNCCMRSLSQPFCPVCRQRWALVYFGHTRVNPTAPITTQAPASPVATEVGAPANFSVVTRFAVGAGVTNDITWRLQGPGYPSPTVVATATSNYTHYFAQTGTFTLTCEVVADTNFIKPPKNGANVDTATWTVNVAASACDPVPSFAGLASATDLAACASGSGIQLSWAPAAFGPDGGSYDIWRDGVRILRGVAASPLVDVPGDAALHTYRVRGATGDCDLIDTNTVDRAASDGSGDAAPAFAGIAAAADLAPCASTGVNVSWNAATFGPSGGTYDVYRDATRVATALTGAPFVDQPGDAATHSYRVAAVSSDCARSDGNAVVQAAADAAGDPAPVFAGLRSAIDLEACLTSGIQLTWDAAVFGAASGHYQIYRDGVGIASAAASPYVDQPGDAATHLYRVAAASNDCGREDGNLTTLPAADGSLDPSVVPDNLGNTLAVHKSGGMLTLAWSAAPNAATYNFYRGETPGAWPPLPDQTGMSFTFLTLAELETWPPFRLYRVSGTTCAGREGP